MATSAHRGRANRRRFVSGVIVMAAVIGLLTAGSAWGALEHPYLSQLTGTPSGGFNHVCGVSVGGPSQNVYVADPGSDAIDVFTPSGAFVSSISGKATAKEEFSPANACSVAVARKSGYVYVADSGPDLVYVFDEHGNLVSTLNGSNTPSESESFGTGYVHVAIDPTTEDVYVADSSDGVIDKFNEKDEYLAQITGAATPQGSFGDVFGLAVAANGELDAIDQGAEVVDRFSPTGEYLSQITGAATPQGAFGTLSGITVGPSNHIYVTDSTSRLVDEFNAAGAFVTATTGAHTPSGSFTEPEGVAEAANGDLYVADLGLSSVVDVFGPAVTIPDATTGPATNVTAAGATLNGTVNPDGAGAVTCQFDLGTTAAYGGTLSCPATIPSGGSPVNVSVPLSGLQPDTTYHVRIEASNSNGTNDGEDVVFTTKGPGIPSEWTTNVASTSAELNAQVNPDGADTTYYFQYGTVSCTSDPSACTDQPAAPGANVGEGVENQSAHVDLLNLLPSTTYYYRVVAHNADGTTEGPEKTFTTQVAKSELTLPDGRAWEMVSPVNKEGAALEGITKTGGLIQAAEDGTAISYLADSATEAHAAGNPSPEYSQILSTRGAAGWESRDIATPHEKDAGFIEGQLSEYKFFSSDLSSGLVEPKGEKPLAPSASEKTVYVRNGLRQPGSEDYEPLVSSANVSSENRFGGQISFDGASPDLSHVILTSGVALTTTPIGSNALYEWTAGELKLVSRLPGGAPSDSPALGEVNRNVRGAVSRDGDRVVWSGENNGAHLYIRDTASEETVEIDAPEAGVKPGEGRPQFQLASEDGSEVLFTDAQRLTHDSTASLKSPDLYEYEVTGGSDGLPLAGKLTDLTVDPTPGQSADVQGVVLGMGESGTDIYFVATGVLTTQGNAAHETAAAGVDNLYVLPEAGAPPTFIAKLSGADAQDWEGPQANLGEVSSRVSPNGRYLAFMSERSLTGNDNHDAAHGEVQDEEVYLYDAAQNRLICASCDPTGARPSGVLDPLEQPWPLYDRRGLWAGRWLAASIPGWTSIDLSRALYQSRYLSNEGRLFFNSSAALVPHDTNGAVDVYEFEPARVGSCEQASEGFSEATQGCVALVSSGASAEESAFLDASASGSDVFFMTGAQLLPQDVDTSMDVYDAHECTRESPCPATAAVVPPCSNTDSCRSPSTPQPPIFGAPPSATLSGGGNVLPPAAKQLVKPKAKPLNRAQKLAKALKACRRQKSKRGRASCEARARKRYGPRVVGKVKRSSRRGK